MDLKTIWILILSGVILPLSIWSIKGYLKERTTRRSPGNQVVTLKEVKDMCSENQKTYRDSMEKDSDHLREILQKDLDHGKQRFTNIESRLSSVEKGLGDVKGQVQGVDAKVDTVLEIVTALANDGKGKA